MATILNRQTTFATNGTVTAAGLHNLIDQTEIYAGIITTQDQIASVGSSDMLLIADADLTSTSAPNRVTVGSMFNDALNNGAYTTGSFTNKVTAGSFVGNLIGNVTGTIVGTSGTLAGFNSTTGTIVGLNSTTGTIVTGTVSTLNSTTGTIATLNSTTSTITNLAATTSTFLGTITGSTNVINIGSGQIYKDASGNVGIGTTSPSGKLSTIGSSAASSVNIDFGNSAAQAVNDAVTLRFLPSTAFISSPTVAPYISAIQTNAGSSATDIAIGTYSGASGTLGERLRIESTGKVLINSLGAQRTTNLTDCKLQAYDTSIGLASNTDYGPQVRVFSAGTTVNAAGYFLAGRSRGSYEAPTAIQTNDVIGSLAFAGYDGTQYAAIAQIFGYVDGAVTTGTVPTAIQFSTGTTGAIGRMWITSSGNVGIGAATPVNKLEVAGSFGRGAPVDIASTPYTVTATDNWLIHTRAGATSINLPAPASWTGRELTIKNTTAFAVTSSSANVVPLAGGAASTALLLGTAGLFTTIVSNGTNWVKMVAG